MKKEVKKKAVSPLIKITLLKELTGLSMTTINNALNGNDMVNEVLSEEIVKSIQEFNKMTKDFWKKRDLLKYKVAPNHIRKQEVLNSVSK